jgi:hypothetical protein
LKGKFEVEKLKYFSQEEYNRVLEKAGGKKLPHSECVQILMAAGATYKQADNGAYIYLHHGNHLRRSHHGSQSEYERLLDEFGAEERGNMECIRYLESLGFSIGQAKNAVYNYRVKKGLIRR